MPDRNLRQRAPGAVQHLIARITDHEYRIAGPEERLEYLQRAARCFVRTDWRPLAFALMSNHVHLVFVAGCDPVARVVRALHTGYARWLNRQHGRFGPVFHGGIGQVVVENTHAARVISYAHNNPVRARLVGDPADIDWTSHRMYLGLDPTPPWLDVARGLSLCGFDDGASGRQAFRDAVLARLGDPRDDQLSGRGTRATRRAVRQSLGAPVEVTGPALRDSEEAPLGAHDVGGRGPLALRLRWLGTVERAVLEVCAEVGVGLEEVQSRARSYRVVAARRITLLLWTRFLWRPQVEVIGWLGITAPAASQLVARDVPGAMEIARRLGARLWREVPFEPERAAATRGLAA